MSRQRSFGPFSGGQLTALIITALVVLGVPGTVFAVDTFSNVAIEDPVSGVKASVDAQHHLKTNDQIAPANFVRIFANATTSCQAVYTVPAGRALILQSITAVVG